jgi:type IV pilus assembly protein PilA
MSTKNKLKLLAVFVVLIFILALCFVPTQMHWGSGPRMNESSAVGTLRTIGKAQLRYEQANPRSGFAASLGDLEPLLQDDPYVLDLLKGRPSGYTFQIVTTTADSQKRIVGYNLAARPTKYRVTGTASFLADSTGAIHYTKEDRPATLSDPVIS